MSNWIVGRFDMGVDPDTVEIGTQLYSPDGDEFEAHLSRQFAYFVRNARNIRLMTSAYAKLRKQKDWGADPRFVGFNPAFTKWLQELPPDLQLSYPPDGSAPWLPSHFVGNAGSKRPLWNNLVSTAFYICREGSTSRYMPS